MIWLPDGADSAAGGPLDDGVTAVGPHAAGRGDGGGALLLPRLGVVPGEEEGGEARVVALGAVGAAEPLLEHLRMQRIW